MKKFKTEMHCHTKESSKRCGKINATSIVDFYINAGYNTLVITDHFGLKHFNDKSKDINIANFLQGYQTAKSYAKDKLNVILGMEINLIENHNDYLIYGLNEEFIYKNYEMFTLPINELTELLHQNNFLIYQAHPFRNRMTIVTPGMLDGIEVFNAHPRHDSRNNIAKMWSEMYNLGTISGSDTHQPPDIARSGITTEKEIKNIDDLLSILRNKNFELITI